MRERKHKNRAIKISQSKSNHNPPNRHTSMHSLVSKQQFSKSSSKLRWSHLYLLRRMPQVRLLASSNSSRLNGFPSPCFSAQAMISVESCSRVPSGSRPTGILGHRLAPLGRLGTANRLEQRTCRSPRTAQPCSQSCLLARCLPRIAPS